LIPAKKQYQARLRILLMSWARSPGHRAGLVIIALSILLSGCGQDTSTPVGPVYSDRPQKDGVPVYVLAVHPLFSPNRLIEAYQPLIDYLNENMPGSFFELEASRDYQTYITKVRARKASFLLSNSWQTLEAIKLGYKVIAEVDAPDDIRGIFVVRRDSKIKTPGDLKGGMVAYSSPMALDGCILPQYFLHQHGLDINKDIHNHYVGSHESAILHVCLGEADAGATSLPVWHTFQQDHPDEAAKLKVIWKTPALKSSSLLVRNDVPVAIANQVRHLLVNLPQTEQGRRIFKVVETERFKLADNNSFTGVRKFIEKFEHEVRPVEQKP
jgi:phosphonate transport system substrate-binding protein